MITQGQFTIVDLFDGEASISTMLLNESQSIACSSGRAATGASKITVPFVAYLGTSRISASATVGTLPTGVTVDSISNEAIIFNIASGANFGGTTAAFDNVSILVTITANGVSTERYFNLTKAISGATARTFFVEPSVSVIVKNDNGTYTPNNLIFYSYYKDGTTAAKTAYTRYWRIETTINGTDWTTLATSTTLANSYTISNIPNGIMGIRATVYSSTALTVATAHDTQSVMIVSNGIQGSPGSPGAPGKDGKGIVSAVVAYQLDTDGVDAPTGAWSSSPPTPIQGRYLWVRTITTYTDATSITTYSVSYIPLDGQKGDPGSPGTPGNGVSSTAVHYLKGTSGSVVPTGTWATAVPTPTQGQYLWTRTVITYTNGTSSTAYSTSYYAINGGKGDTGEPGTPGKDGKDGKGIVSAVVTYQLDTDGVDAPIGVWSNNIPTLIQGRYLWTRTVTTYTDTSVITTYSVSYIPLDGQKGDTGSPGSPGNGVASTAVHYLKGTSGSVVPTGTWSTSVPTPTQGQYLWTRTVITYTNGTSSTAYSTSYYAINGSKGDTGEPGAPGVTTYTWIKFADDANGGGMNDAPEGKRFLGIAVNKTTATESTKAADYSWSPLYDNVVVGGRNLIKNSNFSKGFNNGYITIVEPEPDKPTSRIAVLESTSTNTDATPIYFERFFLEPKVGDTITFSIDFYCEDLINLGPSGALLTFRRSPTQSGGTLTSILSPTLSTMGNTAVDGKWVRMTQTYTFNATHAVAAWFAFGLYASSNASSPLIRYKYREIKVEKGNVSTDYTTAPEDNEGLYTWVRYADTIAGAGISTNPSGKDYIGFAYNKDTADGTNTPGDYTWALYRGPIGVPGGKGDPGDPGNPGKGISSAVVAYKLHTSGTVAPTGTWAASPPTPILGQYLWTRTITTYTDNATVTTYSVSYYPTNGQNGNGVSSTAVHYLKGTSGTVVPTGTWATTVPTPTQGQYLWTRTVITYTNGTTSTAYSTSYYAIDGGKGDPGSPGTPGKSVTSMAIEYYMSTSSTSQAGGSWSTTIPTYIMGRFIWERTRTIFANPTSTEYGTPILSSTWSTINGKSRVIYSETEPPGWNYSTDDVWFDLTNSNRMFYWDGGGWSLLEFGSNAIQDLAITNAKIANATIENGKIKTLDAGKITTGTLHADRIGTDSITTRHIKLDSLDGITGVFSSTLNGKVEVANGQLMTASHGESEAAKLAYNHLAFVNGNVYINSNVLGTIGVNPRTGENGMLIQTGPTSNTKLAVRQNSGALAPMVVKQIELDSNTYASDGGGINLNNSDIIGANSIYMADTAQSSEGFHWTRTNTPAGSTSSLDYDTFRVLDGVGYLNNNPIFTEAERIWTGVDLLGSGSIIVPSRKLSECANGWVLVFSRYINGASGNSDWQTQVIPKVMGTVGGGVMYHGVAANPTATDPPQFVKYTYYNGTDLRGHASNTTGTSNGQCLRYILAY